MMPIRLIPEMTCGNDFSSSSHGSLTRCIAFKSSCLTITSLPTRATRVSQSKKPYRISHPLHLNPNHFTILSCPVLLRIHLSKPGDKTRRQPTEQVPRTTSYLPTGGWIVGHDSKSHLGDLSEGSVLISGTTK